MGACCICEGKVEGMIYNKSKNTLLYLTCPSNDPLLIKNSYQLIQKYCYNGGGGFYPKNEIQFNDKYSFDDFVRLNPS